MPSAGTGVMPRDRYRDADEFYAALEPALAKPDGPADVARDLLLGRLAGYRLGGSAALRTFAANHAPQAMSTLRRPSDVDIAAPEVMQAIASSAPNDAVRARWLVDAHNEALTMALAPGLGDFVSGQATNWVSDLNEGATGADILVSVGAHEITTLPVEMLGYSNIGQGAYAPPIWGRSTPDVAALDGLAVPYERPEVPTAASVLALVDLVGAGDDPAKAAKHLDTLARVVPSLPLDDATLDGVLAGDIVRRGYTPDHARHMLGAADWSEVERAYADRAGAMPGGFDVGRDFVNARLGRLVPSERARPARRTLAGLRTAWRTRRGQSPGDDRRVGR